MVGYKSSEKRPSALCGIRPSGYFVFTCPSQIWRYESQASLVGLPPRRLRLLKQQRVSRYDEDEGKKGDHRHSARLKMVES